MSKPAPKKVHVPWADHVLKGRQQRTTAGKMPKPSPSSN